MRHLKDGQYYIDLYDLSTIEGCLDWEKQIRKNDLTKHKDKKIIKESKEHFKKLLIELPLYFFKGERYRNKDKRIQEWTDRDRQLDEAYKNAIEPREIYCSSCGDKMHSTMKELYDRSNKPTRVLFFFECPSCKKRKGIFDNGEDFKAEPKVCPKCSAMVEVSYLDKDEVTTWTTTCSSCGYIKTDVDDFGDWRRKREQEEKENLMLLRKFRSFYCLSDTEGQKYISSQLAMEQFEKIADEQKYKDEHKKLYSKVASIKRLSVVELEKLLSKILEKEKYIKLSFDKPEMDQYVIIPFTVQEADSKRKEYHSINILKKLFKNTLEDTNWRLMSKGLTYRLGYIYGRLKGYEKEDDLTKLIQIKSPSKTPS